MKLIVEMEMPKNGCSECRLKYKKRGYGGVFYCFNHLCVDKWTYGRTQNGDRPDWCPIKGVLPETHGRLIDEAVFCENVVKYSHQSTKTIGKALDATPTIIEMTPIVTERKDDEQTGSNAPS